MRVQDFTKRTKEEAWQRCHVDGVPCCEYCHRPFGRERPEYHHIVEAYLLSNGGESVANALVVHRKCHKLLTKKRKPEIDKVRRIIEKRQGTTGRKQKIQSRGFQRYGA